MKSSDTSDILTLPVDWTPTFVPRGSPLLIRFLSKSLKTPFFSRCLCFFDFRDAIRCASPFRDVWRNRGAKSLPEAPSRPRGLDFSIVQYVHRPSHLHLWRIDARVPDVEASQTGRKLISGPCQGTFRISADLSHCCGEDGCVAAPALPSPSFGAG